MESNYITNTKIVNKIIVADNVEKSMCGKDVDADFNVTREKKMNQDARRDTHKQKNSSERCNLGGGQQCLP